MFCHDFIYYTHIYSYSTWNTCSARSNITSNLKVGHSVPRLQLQNDAGIIAELGNGHNMSKSNQNLFQTYKTK